MTTEEQKNSLERWQEGRDTGRGCGERKKVKTVEGENVWKVDLGFTVALISQQC